MWELVNWQRHIHSFLQSCLLTILQRIETGRLQGQTIECQTDKGHIKVKAVYGENVKLKTSSGRLLLTNCHGSTVVESDKGDVSIGKFYQFPDSLMCVI